MERDWNNMTNSDIKLELLKLENEYKSKQNEIRKLMEGMDKLDNEYNDGVSELNRRNINI